MAFATRALLWIDTFGDDDSVFIVEESDEEKSTSCDISDDDNFFFWRWGRLRQGYDSSPG